MSRTIAVVISCLVLAGASACAGGDDVTAPSSTPSPAEISLPTQLLGLDIEPEPIRGNLDTVSRSYLDSLGLFGFRTEDDLLRATLQVGRFSDIAEHDKATFRNGIVGQLGSSIPREARLSGTPVYLTTGNDQNIFMWFRERGFFVLSVRDDYEFPRTLLRRLVEMEIVR